MVSVFHNVVCSLSSSLDLVGITEIHHGKRVALMAACVAKKLGWDNEKQLDLLYAGMLHDCGVSTNEEHEHLVSELDWVDVKSHCMRGYEYLNSCSHFQKYATWILHHHTHWNELKILDLSEEDKLAANLIFLVDRVDFLQAPYVNFNGTVDILLEIDSIVEQVLAFRGTFFSPLLVDTFVEISKKESFWLAMDSAYVDSSIYAYENFVNTQQVTMDFAMLRSITGLFSKVIDAKSHYTDEHSKYVAVIARFLALHLGFSLEQQQNIELAGLLHDLGKLRVPDSILMKQAPLEPSERARMLRHSFDTMQLIKRVFPNTRIAEWASYHHENLSGNGYPFHLDASELDLGCRIVAVADVFQALVQNRPYRKQLELAEIRTIMDDMVSDGKLDSVVVSILQEHHQECFYLAQGK